MGAFDDLVPAKQSGAFDDLIPSQAPQQDLAFKVTQDMADKSWYDPANIAKGAGAALYRAGAGLGELVGIESDPEKLKAAEAAMQQSKVGATVGEIVKFAPAALASGIVVPATISAGIGALTTPGDAGDRLKAGALEGTMSAAAGGLAKGITNIAGMGSLDRAKQALMDIIGSSKVAQAKQLATAAPSGVTTAQALTDLNNPTLSALGAMIRGGAGKGDEAARSAQVFSDIASQQEASRLATLEQLARGGSAEESAAARQEIRRILESKLGPVREAELGAANTASQVTSRLAPRIAQKEESMISALQGQGKALTDEAQSSVIQQAGKHGWLGAGQFSQDMGKVADEFGAIKPQRQAERDFLQRQLDSLESYGLRTLQPDAILNRIGTMLKSPETGVSDINQKVLGKVADKVNEWSKNGAIDAKALYEIRKTTINETIDDLMRGADPKASRQMAAKLTAQIRPLIDDAIENAGGTEWKTYIKQYHKGLEGVDRIKLLDEARQLYKTNPKAFMDLVKGESPETVQKIMAGKIGIEDAMTSGTMKKLQGIAGELERDIKLEKLASDPAGKRALANILESDSILTHLPNLLNRYVVIANTAIKSGEMKVNKQMYKHLEKAMRDPKEFAALIDRLPPEQRSKMIGLVYQAQKAGVPQVAGAATGGVMEAQ